MVHNYNYHIRKYGRKNPVKADINRDFVLTIGEGDLTTRIPGRVNYIQQDGRVSITGQSPQIRVLMNQGQRFSIHRFNGGEVMVLGTVLKVEDIEVINVVAQAPDEVESVENELTLLCLLEKCEFFEPVTYEP